MISVPNPTGRRELGQFLRSHRERLQAWTPSASSAARAVVRPVCGARRSPSWPASAPPGSAGSSRAATFPSRQPPWFRLARVLRLNPAERTYLFELAGRRDPEDSSQVVARRPAAQSRRRRRGDRRTRLCARPPGTRSPGTSAARTVRGLAGRRDARNLLRYTFTQSAGRELIVDWQTRARRLAAEFRADFSRHLAAPDTQAVVAELRENSPLFAGARGKRMR